MKTRPKSRRNDGFTLVELLVVIAIIAVLAGAGFAAGNAAIQKAKKTTALATCTSIEAAVNQFFSEYGSMPKDNLTTDTNLNTTSDLDFLRVLLGKENAGATQLNTRAIKFLSAKEGKADKNGLMYDASGNNVTGLYDPWGGPYQVMLDGDYDEKISVTPGGGSSKTLNKRVAAWSNGADAAPTGTGGKTGDNVITW